MNCDIVIKSFARDYSRLLILLRSIRKYFSDYNKLYIILDDDLNVSAFKNDIFSIISDADISVVPSGGSDGYLIQQFYKLNGSNFSDSEYLLPLDSDMVFFRNSSPFEWLFESKAFIPFGSWRSPQNFPPTEFMGKLVEAMGYRTHDLHSYVRFIRLNGHNLEVDILEDLGEKLVLKYKGSVYDIDANRPHTTWLSSIKSLAQYPIDSMRQHYMFTALGIDRVKSDITKYSQNSNLLQSMLDFRKFPVFSEYQVYGNILNNYKENDYGHILIGESEPIYREVVGSLPIVKCNTRTDSAFEMYEEIINGRFQSAVNRGLVLSEIRNARKSWISEEWV